MKKSQTVQGTFSKIFGKKHASPTAASLYVTNPPWIFTQEAPEEGARVLGKCARGEAAAPPRSALPAGLPAARGGGHGTRWDLWTGQDGAAGEGGGAAPESPGMGCGGRGAEGGDPPSLPPGGRRPLRPRRIRVFLPRCLLSLLAGRS